VEVRYHINSSNIRQNTVGIWQWIKHFMAGKKLIGNQIWGRRYLKKWSKGKRWVGMG